MGKMLIFFSNCLNDWMTHHFFPVRWCFVLRICAFSWKKKKVYSLCSETRKEIVRFHFFLLLYCQYPFDNYFAFGWSQLNPPINIIKYFKFISR